MTAPLKTPDVTWVQALVAAGAAVISAAIGVVNSFGWANITVDQSAKLLGLWAALGGVAILADAIIRHGRSTAQAQSGSASVELSATVPAKKAARSTTRRTTQSRG